MRWCEICKDTIVRTINEKLCMFVCESCAIKSIAEEIARVGKEVYVESQAKLERGPDFDWKDQVQWSFKQEDP